VLTFSRSGNTQLLYGSSAKACWIVSIAPSISASVIRDTSMGIVMFRLLGSRVAACAYVVRLRVDLSLCLEERGKPPIRQTWRSFCSGEDSGTGSFVKPVDRPYAELAVIGKVHANCT
jgi:hypothetical protein